MTKLARTSLIASPIALALAGAPLAAQDAPPGGFRLPTPTPTATDIQGPVDPDRPILTRPRDTAPTPEPLASPATPEETPAQLMRRANAAFRENRIVDPSGDNATELFLAVRERAPDHPGLAEALVEIMPLAQFAFDAAVRGDDLARSVRKVVNDRDRPSRVPEREDGVAADIAGAAGDEDWDHVHAAPLAKAARHFQQSYQSTPSLA